MEKMSDGTKAAIIGAVGAIAAAVVAAVLTRPPALNELNNPTSAPPSEVHHGSVSVSIEYTYKDWKPPLVGPDILTTTVQTPDHGSKSKNPPKFPIAETFIAPENTIFVRPFTTAIAGPMGVFSTVDNTNNYIIPDGGHTLLFNFLMWGPSFLLTYGAHINTLQDVSKSDNQEGTFGSNFTFTLPPTGKWSKITYRDYQNQVGELVNGSQNPSINVISENSIANGSLKVTVLVK